MENKKMLEIKGTLLYPVTVGMPAVISEEEGVRRTSRVLSVKKISQTEISFETLNTNYLLHLAAKEVAV